MEIYMCALCGEPSNKCHCEYGDWLRLDMIRDEEESIKLQNTKRMEMPDDYVIDSLMEGIEEEEG